MSILQTGLNTLLLGGTIAVPVLMMRGRGRRARRDLMAGAVAAVLALGLLLLLRLQALSWITTWPTRENQFLLHLAILALVEETAKYAVIAPWRQRPERRHSRAARRGLGFAGAEHLLFLLIPTGLFARRLLLATTLHVGTALLYSRPLFIGSRKTGGPYASVLRPGSGGGTTPAHRVEPYRAAPNHGGISRGFSPPVYKEGPAPIRDLFLIAVGTAIHLAYNLVLQGLDGLIVF